jgi:serine/threonine protein kinase
MLKRHADISENLVQFYGSWTQGQTHNILLEYADGGTLADFFRCGHPTSKEDRLKFWNNLLRLLEPIGRIHIHADPDDRGSVIEGYVDHYFTREQLTEHCSIHQDIKPDNILVALNASSSSEFDCNFKLVDLGLTYFHTVSKQKAKSRIRDARGTQMFSELFLLRT